MFHVGFPFCYNSAQRQPLRLPTGNFPNCPIGLALCRKLLGARVLTSGVGNEGSGVCVSSDSCVVAFTSSQITCANMPRYCSGAHEFTHVGGMDLALAWQSSFKQILLIIYSVQSICRTCGTRESNPRRMLKKAVLQGRSRGKHRRRSILHPPIPSCQDSSFPKWATLRMLSRRERRWQTFSAS